ncbi:MAG: F0F1 ATP synthase subunit B [Nisaea sp.]|jgi:F-type H+-transporting ATPase subunit b|nr:F0F1 ATP synthase subunit B [Nisaea sp.]MDA8574902.1 F0F1 ATP synthase subunit B [Alphaproteobacteria bacterium]OUX93937.1 MAG: F0F1 ATP synthase subunit B [Candidatus Endolissoclinum sp. TMED26]|tara:strand:- start:396 stop:878 length:483 start_codon:yes stop_codon:yes gene_type:complete
MISDPTFWVAIGFVLFIVIAGRPIMAKITSALDNRADEIRAKIEEAKSLREEAQTLLASYQRMQRDAAAEAAEIISNAQEEAQRLQTAADENLTQTLKRREEAALEKIAAAEARALQDVRDRAVDIAISATEKVVSGAMTDNVQQSITRAAIDDLPSRLQ